MYIKDLPEHAYSFHSQTLTTTYDDTNSDIKELNHNSGINDDEIISVIKSMQITDFLVLTYF